MSKTTKPLTPAALKKLLALRKDDEAKIETLHAAYGEHAEMLLCQAGFFSAMGFKTHVLKKKLPTVEAYNELLDENRFTVEKIVEQCVYEADDAEQAGYCGNVNFYDLERAGWPEALLKRRALLFRNDSPFEVLAEALRAFAAEQAKEWTLLASEIEDEGVDIANHEEDEDDDHAEAA